ncbi:MAG: hypothetical protein R2758_07520 [Bacteroidales bacterium]
MRWRWALLFYKYIIKESRTLCPVPQPGQHLFIGLKDIVDRWHPHYLVTGALTTLPFSKPEDYL